MTDLDFESDQLLFLLTDALHTGPGSPAWHDALARLRESGVQSADELAMLLRVREDLESGKSFRTIRAGGGFTNRLMHALDAEPAAPQTPRNRSIVLVASVAIVLLTAAAIATMIWRNKGSADGDIVAGVLINTVASVDFDNGLPEDWQTIGGLPLTIARKALIPDPAKQSEATGGGIAWTKQLPAIEPFSFSAEYHLPRSESRWAAELFISDDPIFSVTTSITPHEFVWLCQSRNIFVISPSGKVLTQQPAPDDARNLLRVRLTVNGSQISVEQAGKIIWSGPHELDISKAHTVGLRFLRTGLSTVSDAGFSRVRVNARQTAP